MRAIGLVEVEGVAGIIVAGDAACKTAEVELLGWDSIGGFTTIFFAGSVADVAAALDKATLAARDVVEHVVAATLNRPESVCARYITHPINSEIAVEDAALGLIETRGYGAQVYNNDRMVKEAPVQVRRVLTIHNRVVCTLIQGEVAAVLQAVDVARNYLASSDDFLSGTVIPRPVASVLRAFGGVA